jgi:putative toxin-antitoxin system antitoxin component (TIGR02293 family)
MKENLKKYTLKILKPKKIVYIYTVKIEFYTMVKKNKPDNNIKNHISTTYKSLELEDDITKPIETPPKKGNSYHQDKVLTKETKIDSVSLKTDLNKATTSKRGTNKLPVVKEPFVSYSLKLTSEDSGIDRGLSQGRHNRDFTIILSEAADKPEAQMMPLEKMSIVRIGVSKKDLEGLKEKTALDYDKLAKALSVTRATLINKKREEKFNASLSERIVGLADIYSYGYEVFEDGERFNQWMFRPNRALGGQAPYDLIDNQFGREEIRNIIGRIEYGVYS